MSIRRAILLAIAFAAIGTVSGCTRAQFAPSARLGQFACMCAVCSTGAFCYNPNNHLETAIPTSDGMCPVVRGVEYAPAQNAFALTSSGYEPLFCAPDRAGQQLGAADGTCPANRMDAAWVDPCEDVPECARRGDRYTACPTTLSSCPDPLDDNPDLQAGTNMVCEAATSPSDTNELLDQRVRDKAVAICDHFHDRGIPTSPARYCFLSCLDVNPTGERECEMMDPPFIASVGGIRLDVGADPRTGERSEATIALDGASSTTYVEGSVWLSTPGCGPGEHCTAAISWVDLRTTAAFSVRGETVTNVRLLNEVPLRDSITPLDAEHSVIQIEPGGTLYASGDGSTSGRTGIRLEVTEAIVGDLFWAQRAFELRAEFSDESGNATLSLTMRGRIPSVPPRADAGPDQVVECSGPDGTPVALSGAASSDPDGDITSYVWTTSAGTQTSSERDPTMVLPLGDHTVRLVARDALGQADMDAARVQVRDTQGPELETLALATDCLWPPDHSLHLFRLGEELVADPVDVCEGTASAESTVRIVDVRSDQPTDSLGDGVTAPDVLFGDTAFCLRGERAGTSQRPRTYTVVLETTDAAGNTSQHEVVIDVPHDQRPSERCINAGLAPAVADDDPRCTASRPETEPVVAPAEAGCAASGRPGGVSGLALFLALLMLGWIRRRS